MMMESDEVHDEKSLAAAIHEKSIESARFCACSASGMSARQLIEFFAARGEPVPASDGFSTEPTKICDHSHDWNRYRVGEIHSTHNS